MADIELSVGVQKGSLKDLQSAISQLINEAGKSKSAKIDLGTELNTEGFKSFQTQLTGVLNSINESASATKASLQDMSNVIQEINSKKFDLNLQLNDSFAKAEGIEQYKSQVKDFVKGYREAVAEVARLSNSGAFKGPNQAKFIDGSGRSIAEQVRIMGEATSEYENMMSRFSNRMQSVSTFTGAENVAKSFATYWSTVIPILEKANSLGLSNFDLSKAKMPEMPKGIADSASQMQTALQNLFPDTSQVTSQFQQMAAEIKDVLGTAVEQINSMLGNIGKNVKSDGLQTVGETVRADAESTAESINREKAALEQVAPVKDSVSKKEAAVAAATEQLGSQAKVAAKGIKVETNALDENNERFLRRATNTGANGNLENGNTRNTLYHDQRLGNTWLKRERYNLDEQTGIGYWEETSRQEVEDRRKQYNQAVTELAATEKELLKLQGEVNRIQNDIAIKGDPDGNRQNSFNSTNARIANLTAEANGWRTLIATLNDVEPATRKAANAQRSLDSERLKLANAQDANAQKLYDSILHQGTNKDYSDAEKRVSDMLGKVRELREQYGAAEKGQGAQQYARLGYVESALSALQGNLDGMAKSDVANIFATMGKTISEATAEMDRLGESSRRIISGTPEFDKYTSTIDNLRDSITKGISDWSAAEYNTDTQVAYENIKQLKDQLDTLKAGMANGMPESEITASIQRISAAFKEAGQVISDHGMKTKQILNQDSAEYNKYSSEIQGLINKISAAQTNWSAAAHGGTKVEYGKLGGYINQLQNLQTQLDSTGVAENKLKDIIAKVDAEFTKSSGVIQSAGKNHKSFLAGLTDFSGVATSMLSATRIAYAAIRTIKTTVKNAIELQSSLADLQIVTGASGDEFDDYAKSVTNTARALGVATKDVITATTTYARLGYGLEESDVLSKYTTMLEKVGNIQAENAQNAVTAILAAFKDDANVDNIESIMDKLVTVGNNFPISVEQIAEGMNNASSALAAAGNNFDESVALLAAANTTIQNASKSSTGLRTIAARIQNTTADLKELGEEDFTEAKYGELVQALTDQNVQITDMNGQYRSTYEIVGDIAKQWDKMDSKSRAALATAVAGTRQQAVFYSLIENFNDVAAKSMDAMGNSAGSMESAYDIYLGTIQAHLESLKSSFSGLAYEALSAVTPAINAIMDLLSSGTSSVASTISNIAPAFELVGEAASGVISIISALSGAFGTLASNSPAVSTGIIAIVTAIAMLGKTAAAAGGGIAGMSDIFALISLNPAAVILPAIIAIGGAISQYKKNIKEAKEAAEDYTDSVSSRASTMDGYIEKVDELKNKIESGKLSQQELYSAQSELVGIQGELVAAFGSEAQGIDLITTSATEAREALINLKNAMDVGEAKEYRAQHQNDYERAKRKLGEKREESVLIGPEYYFQDETDVKFIEGLEKIVGKYAGASLDVDDAGQIYLHINADAKGFDEAVTGIQKDLVDLGKELGVNSVQDLIGHMGGNVFGELERWRKENQKILDTWEPIEEAYTEAYIKETAGEENGLQDRIDEYQEAYNDYLEVSATKHDSDREHIDAIGEALDTLQEKRQALDDELANRYSSDRDVDKDVTEYVKSVEEGIDAATSGDKAKVKLKLEFDTQTEAGEGPLLKVEDILKQFIGEDSKIDMEALKNAGIQYEQLERNREAAAAAAEAEADRIAAEEQARREQQEAAAEEIKRQEAIDNSLVAAADSKLKLAKQKRDEAQRELDDSVLTDDQISALEESIGTQKETAESASKLAEERDKALMELVGSSKESGKIYAELNNAEAEASRSAKKTEDLQKDFESSKTWLGEIREEAERFERAAEDKADEASKAAEAEAAAWAAVEAAEKADREAYDQSEIVDDAASKLAEEDVRSDILHGNVSRMESNLDSLKEYVDSLRAERDSVADEVAELKSRDQEIKGIAEETDAIADEMDRALANGLDISGEESVQADINAINAATVYKSVGSELADAEGRLAAKNEALAAAEQEYADGMAALEEAKRMAQESDDKKASLQELFDSAKAVLDEKQALADEEDAGQLRYVAELAAAETSRLNAEAAEAKSSADSSAEELRQAKVDYWVAAGKYGKAKAEAADADAKVAELQKQYEASLKAEEARGDASAEDEKYKELEERLTKAIEDRDSKQRALDAAEAEYASAKQEAIDARKQRNAHTAAQLNAVLSSPLVRDGEITEAGQDIVDSWTKVEEAVSGGVIAYGDLVNLARDLGYGDSEGNVAIEDVERLIRDYAEIAEMDIHKEDTGSVFSKISEDASKALETVQGFSKTWDEALSGDALSVDSVSKLTEAFKEIEGFDPEKLFKFEGDKTFLNADYFSDMQKRLTDKSLEDLDDYINEYDSRIAELRRKRDIGEIKTDEDLEGQVQQEKNRLVAVKAYAAALREATSAQHELESKAAGTTKNLNNLSDVFESVADGESLSADQVKNTINAFKDIDGFNLNELFTVDADGVGVNLDKFRSLRARYLDQSAQDIDKYIAEYKSQIAELNPDDADEAAQIAAIESNILVLEALKDAMSETISEEKELESVTDKAKKTMESLASAFEDSLEGKSLTGEQVKDIIGAFEDLEGFDPTKMFTSIGGMTMLNQDYFSKMQEQYYDSQLAELDKYIDGYTSRMANLYDRLSSGELGQSEYDAGVAAAKNGLAEAMASRAELEATMGVVAQFDKISERVTKKASAITSAFGDAFSGKNLSADQVTGLIDAFSGLQGFNVKDLFDMGTGGMNLDAFRDLQSQYLQSAYNELDRYIDDINADLNDLSPDAPAQLVNQFNGLKVAAMAVKSALGDMVSETHWADTAFSEHEKNVSSMKDIYEAAYNGEAMTAEQIKNMYKAFKDVDGFKMSDLIYSDKDGVKVNLETLRDYIDDYIKLINEKAEEEKAALGKELLDPGTTEARAAEIESQIASWDAATAAVENYAKEIRDLSKIDIDSALDAMNTAMQENATSAGLSLDTYQSLYDSFKVLSGFDSSKLFSISSKGIGLNIEEADKLRKAAINQEIAQNYERINEIVGDGARELTEAERQEVDVLNARNALLSQTPDLMETYLDSKYGKEQHQTFQSIAEDFENMNSVMKSGWGGNTQMKGYLEDIYGMGTDKTFASISEEIEGLGMSLKDVFTFDADGSFTPEGLIKLAKAINKVNPELVELGKNADGTEKIMSSLSDSSVEALADFLGTDVNFARNIAEAWNQISISADYATEALYSKVDGIKAKFDSIQSAISESFSSAGLSTDSLRELTQQFSTLKGYDPASLFELTSSGIHLNVEEAAALHEQFVEMQKMELDDYISSLISQYSDLQKEMDNSADSADDLNNILAQQQSLRNQINEAEMMKAALDGITSSYNQYITVKGQEDRRGQADTMLGDYEHIQDLINNGWVNDPEVTEFLNTWLGKDKVAEIGDNEKAFKSLSKEIGNTGKSMKDIIDASYDKDGNFVSDGLYDLLDVVNKIDSTAAGKDKNGNYWFDFSGEKIYEVADALGISVNMLQIFERAMQDAGFDVKFDSLSQGAVDAAQKLRDLGLIKFKIGDPDDMEKTEKQINKLKKLIDGDTFRDKDGNLDYSMPGLAEAQYLLDELEQRLENAKHKFDIDFEAPKQYEKELPTITAPDADNVVNKDALDRLDQVQEKIQTINELNSEIQYNQERGNDVSEEMAAREQAMEELRGLLGDETGQELNEILNIDTTNAQTAVDSFKSTVEGDPIEVKAQLTELIKPEGDEEITIDCTAKFNSEFDGAQPEDKSGYVYYTSVWDGAEPPSKTGYVYYTSVFGGGGGGRAQGTAHAGGTTSGRAFKSGYWGAKESGVALMGEVGPELVVRDGHFFTVGDDSAGLYNYKKGDIIFNAEQTRQIFSAGKIKNGKKRGVTYAEGTAFDKGSGGHRRTSTSSHSGSGGGGSYDGGGGGNGGGSEKKDKDKKIDWIEVAVDRVERVIKSLSESAESAFLKLTKRLGSSADEIERISTEIQLAADGAERYFKEAESIEDISEEIKQKVKDGVIDITKYGKEEAEKIEEYKKWYEKGLDMLDKIDELHEDIAEAYKKRFEMVQKDYENQLDLIEHQADMIDKDIDMAKEKGYLDSQAFYERLSELQTQSILIMKNELDDLNGYLQDALDSGEIEEYSESWYEMKQDIQKVEEEIAKANIELQKYQNTIREIGWDVFDFVQDRVKVVTDEVQFLIDLMSNDQLFDERGQFTQYGMSTLGLHALSFDTFMAQADEYAKEIKKIKEELANDPNDQELINRYEELLGLQQDNISAAEQEKDAVRDLVQEGIQKELDALTELIDKYEESIDSAEDLYDYQKKLADKTGDIAQIQKQLAAYANDESEENKARLQKLRDELDKKQEDLYETEYKQSITEQKKLLDDLYDEYEKLLNSRLDDIEKLMSEMIDVANENAVEIKDGVIAAAEFVGYTITDELNMALDKQYAYYDHMFTSFAGITEILSQIYDRVNAMARASGAVKAYSSGGLVDYTGLAAVHGTQTNPELVLNAADTQRFIQMVSALRAGASISDLSSKGFAVRDMGGLPGSGVNIGALNVSIPIDHVQDYNDMLAQMRDDKKFEKLIDAMTIDRIAGGSRYNKHKVNI